MVAGGHQNNQLKDILSFINQADQYIKNNKNGEWNYWYKSGKQEKLGNYVNDLMDGDWRGWYYTGQKFYLRTYNNGKKEGKWVWWLMMVRKNMRVIIKMIKKMVNGPSGIKKAL